MEVVAHRDRVLARQATYRAAHRATLAAYHATRRATYRARHALARAYGTIHAGHMPTATITAGTPETDMPKGYLRDGTRRRPPPEAWPRSARTRRAAVEQRIREGKKPCTRCGEVKVLGDYSPMPSARDGRDSICRACRAPIARVRYRAQRALQLEAERTEREYAKQRHAILVMIGRAPRPPTPPATPGCCTPDTDGGHDRSCPFRPRARAH
jgi:hypothetical protein